MDGSSSTNQSPSADNIWDTFSRISQGLPRQAPQTHREEIGPLQVGETVQDQGGPDEGTIMDMLGALLSGPKPGPAAVISGGFEAAKQLYQHATQSPSAPQTTEEAAKRIGTTALESAVGTKVGQWAGDGIGAVGKKIFQRPMTTDAARAQKFAAGGFDGVGPANALPMTPGQMTDNHLYSILENVGKGSVFGGGPLKNFDVANEDLTKRTIEKYADSLGKALDKEQLGEMFVRMNRGDLMVAQAPAKAMYSAIERDAAPQTVTRTVMKPSSIIGTDGKPILMPTPTEVQEGGAWVDMRALKAWAKPIADRADETANLGTDITGGALAKRIMSMDDHVTYGAAKDLRQVARALSSEFKVNNKSAPAIGVARKVEGSLTKNISDALGEFNPALQQSEREANKIWAQSSKQYDNTFVRHLVKVATEKEGGMPSAVTDMIVKPQGATLIRRAKQAINAEGDGQELWQSFGRKTMLSAIEKSYQKDGKSVDFQKLHNMLFSKADEGETAGYGMKVLNELYSPEQINWIREAVNVGVQQQKKSPTEVGKMMIQMKTAGAIAVIGGGMYAGGYEGAAAGATAVLLGPELIARMMTHPESAKWFVKGMQTQAGAPGAAAIEKSISRELGILPGHGALTIPGRILSQRVGSEIKNRDERLSQEGVSLPPALSQPSPLSLTQ